MMSEVDVEKLKEKVDELEMVIRYMVQQYKSISKLFEPLTIIEQVPEIKEQEDKNAYMIRKMMDVLKYASYKFENTGQDITFLINEMGYGYKDVKQLYDNKKPYFTYKFDTKGN